MSSEPPSYDLETTRVSDLRSMTEELSARGKRDQAYLIVLAGNEVGKMYKMKDGVTVIGRSQRADIQLEDDSISRMHVKLVLQGARVTIEDLNSSNGTLVNGSQIENLPLKDGDKIRVGETTILKFTFHDRLDEVFQRKMYDAALRDPLTRIFNKKYLLDQLRSEFAYARRHRSPLSLLIFDLDHFKNINDTYGHVAGDYVLLELAQMVGTMLRAEDIFARYGGEEFVILLRATPIEPSGALAERLREAIEQKKFVFEGRRLPVTVSIGVACIDETIGDSSGLVAAADEALYQAKRSGRNRVLLRCRD